MNAFTPALSRHADSVGSSSPADPNAALATAISALGTSAFGTNLIVWLNALCGADHCAAYALDTRGLEEVTASSLDGTTLAHQRVNRYLTDQFWRRDPIVISSGGPNAASSTVPAISRVKVAELADPELRHVIYPGMCDRVVISGGDESSRIYCISLLRSERSGHFTDGDCEHLSRTSRILVSLLSKHARLSRMSGISGAECSREANETALTSMRLFPRREVQVVARILVGMTNQDIGLEIGIGCETVKTYRKRAYRRLGVTCELELMQRLTSRSS